MQRSASLFLVKIYFIIADDIFYGIDDFISVNAIAGIVNKYVYNWYSGILLALEPNKSRIKGHFLGNVLLKALPAGLTDFFAVSALVICGHVLISHLRI